MENNNFPPGFRFRPTDEELIIYYLGNKITHQALPCQGLIHDVLLYSHSPDQLTAMFDNRGEDAWYFFTPRDKKYKNGTRPDKSVVEYGYWRLSGKDKKVIVDGIVIGTRKTLCYFEGKQSNKNKTDWKMQEFVAEPGVFSPPQRDGNNGGVDMMRLNDWVLCKIYGSSHDEKQGKGGGPDNGASSSSTPHWPSPPPSQYGGFQPPPFPNPHHIMSSTGFCSTPQTPNYYHRVMSSSDGGCMSPPMHPFNFGGGQLEYGVCARLPMHPVSPQSHIPHDMSNTSGSSLHQPMSYGGSSIPSIPIINNVIVMPPVSSGPSICASSNCNDKYMVESENCFGQLENKMLCGDREVHHGQDSTNANTNINTDADADADANTNINADTDADANAYCDSPEFDFDATITLDDEPCPNLADIYN